jgi:hypothetical protein
VFITDTNHNRMEQLLKKKEKEYKIFPISEGSTQKAQPSFV